MGYNMYDRNYGSGFTPENDNRPPEQRPGYAGGGDDAAHTTGENGEYHYSFQPADEESASAASSTSSASSYASNPTGYSFQTGFTASGRGSQSRRRSGKRGWVKVVAAVLACLLMGGAAGAGGAYLMFSRLNGSASGGGAGDSTGSSATPTLQMSDSDRPAGTVKQTVHAGDTMTPSQIYEAYQNSVVSIEVQTASGIGAGTGFLISDDGYILTCYHVVKGYQAISVTFVDSSSYEATYVGGDEDADLAVIKIEPKDGTTLTPVVIGDSSQLVIGSTVSAIGNALGTFANTLTSGTVSGLDRALTMEDGTVMNVLQTDCTINSGNSGGPLFNEYGEVIGVVNAKYSSSIYSNTASIEGIGFAIPINDAMAILDDLITHGYITGKPYLGISVATVNSITAQQYSNMVVGAYVRSVEEGSCSEKAGLQVGDIITQVDNKDITTYEELIDAKNTKRAGDELTLTVYRDNSYLTLVVTLDEEAPDDAAAASQPQQGSNGYGYGYSNPYDFFNDFFGSRGW